MDLNLSTGFGGVEDAYATFLFFQILLYICFFRRSTKLDGTRLYSVRNTTFRCQIKEIYDFSLEIYDFSLEKYDFSLSDKRIYD